MFNRIEIDYYCLKDLFIESNRTELQTDKVEERTFGTPCNSFITQTDPWIMRTVLTHQT